MPQKNHNNCTRMKFQIGDKVIVQHSNEEGEIVDIIDKKMVMVDVRGVQFPAYIDQLDFPYFKRFTEKKDDPKKNAKKFIDQVSIEKKERISKTADGVWLTFLPVFESDEFGDDIVDVFKIHLVNNSPLAYHFIYRVQYAGKTGFELQNDIYPMKDFYLHDIPFENLNDSPSFELDCSLLKADPQKASHFESSLKPRARQVFQKIEEIRKKGEAVFSYKLFDTYPNQLVEEVVPMDKLTSSGYRIYDASRARQHLEPAKYEIDLHVEKLTDEWQRLNNFEILTLQLQTLEKWMDLAIAHRQPSLVVIHGLGTGKLRDDIHEILRLKKEVKSFVNQYHPRYGYGATEIFFQYK
jgi:hypothetical protein